MKKIIIITAAVLSFFTSVKLNAQGLNGQFENWDSTETDLFKDFMPTGWINYTNQYCAMENKELAITRTTDANSGNYAIKLKNIATSIPQPAMLMTGTVTADGSSVNKVPVDKRYTKLEGFYKYSTQITDTFSIVVFMLQGEDIVGGGELKKSANTTAYTKFSIPIMYFGSASIIPDSVAIIISAGSMQDVKEGSTLLIDDVNFAPLNTGINEVSELQAQVTLFPNPSSDVINISAQQVAHGDVKIELVNLIGQVLKSTTVTPVGQAIETSFTLVDMPKGILFVKVSDNSGSKGFRVIHQ